MILILLLYYNFIITLLLCSLQEYIVNDGVLQGFILGPTLFLLYINDPSDDVICNIAVYADDTTLYYKYDQTPYLWQQIEMAFELESDLQETVDWGGNSIGFILPV